MMKNCLWWIQNVSLSSIAIFWIQNVSMSPIAILLLILIALFNLLQFIYKVMLLFIIVVIQTPFVVMCNVSILVFQYKLARFRKSRGYDHRNPFDPRASVGIEVQLIVSDFFKVVAGELLLVLSTGVITFYTAPKLVFYISMAIGVIAILLKWLNTNSLSKVALSCICDGLGLNSMMFLFSFIGLFDIGCHPIAKCSFAAERAFLFEKDVSNTSKKEDFKERDIEKNLIEFKGPFSFKSEVIDLSKSSIDFLKWNAFEKGLFQLNSRIYFIKKKHGKCILKSFMVLKLMEVDLCKYPVERLELPEDYTKVNELYHFLVTLSSENGFVTDKMRGRYEHSLTLLEIVDGVEENSRYRTMQPMDGVFVVAICTKKTE